MNTAPHLSSLGKYRLIATIGHGGMAHIHLALMAGPAGFNKLLVIKALRDDVGINADEFVAMFLDEARLAARLSHPNIVQTYEVGQAEGRYFIAMEYLEGQSLKTVERRMRPESLPLPAQLRILAEVAKGLHHAHELRGYEGEPLNVVHRDVSPHNVFLTYDGQVKLLDFGIAKASNALHLTKVGVIKGKAEYIAPEQIRGEEVDRRADVFSLGVMLWEVLTNQRFAGGPEVPEITKMHNRLTGSERRLSSVRSDVPERLVDICERAIAVAPEQRQSTALQFAQELEEYLSDASIYPTSQQLADAITPLFQKEREQLRKLVALQMKSALEPGAAVEGGTGQLPMLARQTFASGIWHMPGGAVSAQGHTPATSLRSSYTTSSFAGPMLEQSRTLQELARVTTEPRKPKAPWSAVMGLVVMAVGAAAYLGFRPSLPRNEAHASSTTTGTAHAPDVSEPVPAASTSPSAAAPAHDRAASADKVRLSIRVQPSNARVLLDGARIGRIPFEAEVERGRSVHTLEVYAPGHVQHREMLTYERDQTVRVRLARESRRHGRPEQAPRADANPRTSQAGASAASAMPGAGAGPSPSSPPEEVQPGMDFRRIAPRPTVNSSALIEEDPYR